MNNILLLIALSFLSACANPPVGKTVLPSVSSSVSSLYTKQDVDEWRMPLTHGKERITKKSFGIHVLPENSPVSPERFSGYHTGVDFEILSGEEGMDVSVVSVCAGAVTFRHWVKGYGGVLIQECALPNADRVSVLYGHLNINSILLSVGDTLSVGDRIGLLGEAYSDQTDGERKHLHLSVHIGSARELRGYVEKNDELKEWMDPLPLLLGT